MASENYLVDNVPPAISNLIVTHIRVVAHTLGPVAPGAQLSQNHRSLYLVHSKGSVRFNMQIQDPQSNSTRGLLTVKNYPYTSVSTSAVKSWEFKGTNDLAIYYILQAIIDNGRSNYDMTEGGVGCRYWIFVVMADLVALNYVSVVSTDGATIESVIQYNYSINMDPVYLEIKPGTFLQHTQTNPEPSALSSSFYSAQTYPVASASSSSSYSVASASSSSAYSSAPYSQPTSNASTLDDNDYINVTCVERGRDIASSVYRFRTPAGSVEKRGDQFYQATHQNGHSCMVYYGVNSQRHYWTWSLL